MKSAKNGLPTGMKTGEKCDFQNIYMTCSAVQRPEEAHLASNVHFISKEYLEKYASVIDVVTEALLTGKPNQSDILKHCKDYGIGRRSCESVLKRYSQGLNMLWHRERAFQKNAWSFERVNKQPSP